MTISHGVHNGHRAGQRELEFFAGVGPRQLRLEGVHPALEPQRCHHLRHLSVIAAIADAHGHLVLEIDAVYLLQKAVYKMLARLFAVAHDVQARILLRLDPEQRGISLGLLQLSALRLPLRPEFFCFGQPSRFRQTACD